MPWPGVSLPAAMTSLRLRSSIARPATRLWETAMAGRNLWPRAHGVGVYSMPPVEGGPCQTDG